MGSRIRQRSCVQPAQYRVPRRRCGARGRLRPIVVRQDRLSLSRERVRVDRIALGQASATERNPDRAEHGARARPHVRPAPCPGLVVRPQALRGRELRRPLRHDGQRHRRLRLLREMAAWMDHTGDPPGAVGGVHTRADRGSVGAGSGARRHDDTQSLLVRSASRPGTRRERSRGDAGRPPCALWSEPDRRSRHVVIRGPLERIDPGSGRSRQTVAKSRGPLRGGWSIPDRCASEGRLLVQVALRVDGYDAAQEAGNRVSWSARSPLGEYRGDVARLVRTGEWYCGIPDLGRSRTRSLDHAKHLSGAERCSDCCPGSGSPHRHDRRDRPRRQPQPARNPSLRRGRQLTPGVNVLGL